MKMNGFKKILVFCFVAGAIFLLDNSVQAVVTSPKTSLTNGLKGWWTFDGIDFKGGRANDVTGNGNFASTRNIATSTFYTAGKIGQAINCDGTDDNLGFNSDPIGTGAVTISAWIKPRSFGNTSGGGSATFVWANSTRFRISRLSGPRVEFSSDGLVTTAFSAPISLNNWMHVLVTRNSSNQATIYVDGNQSGQANQASGTPTGSTAGGICESVASSIRFDGFVDDLRIYNRVLSLSEIKELYNQGNSKVNATPKDTLKTNLVGWWTFDGKNILNGAAIDLSGLGNTGSLTNISTSTFYTNGRVGQAFNFDGTDDYVDAGSAASLDDISPISGSLWFYVPTKAQPNVQSYLVDKETSASGGAGWYLQYSNSSGGFLTFSAIYSGGTYSAATPQSSLPIRSGRWNHVVFTWDHDQTSSTGVKIYINGSSQPLTVTTTTGTYNSDAVRNLRIGAGTSSGRNYMGIIDDVRLYNKILTSTEVTYLYNQGLGSKLSVSPKQSLKNGLVGWWTFDGKDTTWTSNVAGTTRDSSGNGFTGTFTTAFMATTTRAGIIGQSFSPTGVGTFVQVTDNDLFTFSTADTTDKPYTFTAWVKRDGTQSAPGGGGAIISKSAGAGNPEYMFWITNTDKLEIRNYDNSGNNQIVATSNATITEDNNKWVFYAVTYTGSGLNSGFSLYRNGLQMSTTLSTQGTYVAMENMTGTLNIGNFFYASLSFRVPFKGQIDDVRVYNRVLSANELKELYNQAR